MSLPTATRPSFTPPLPATGQPNCTGTSLSGTAASRAGSLKTHLPSPVQPVPPVRLGEILDATPRCRPFQPPQRSSCYAACCNCSMATGTPMTTITGAYGSTRARPAQNSRWVCDPTCTSTPPPAVRRIIHQANRWYGLNDNYIRVSDGILPEDGRRVTYETLKYGAAWNAR
jgi:hypothetical protein